LRGQPLHLVGVDQRMTAVAGERTRRQGL